MTTIREIVLDTETTGFDPTQNHRIIEIGCVELENHLPTGRILQLYINPERDVPAEATAIHGITNEFLKDKPVFTQVYGEFIDFIKDAKLVIHNAEFDMRFINHHLGQVGHKAIAWSNVVDTLGMARKKFPGSPASLDALCRRFGIDASERTYHGALLDSQLLAEVYLELMGGRQHGLGLASELTKIDDFIDNALPHAKKIKREPRSFPASSEELESHTKLVGKLGQGAVWNQTS